MPDRETKRYNLLFDIRRSRRYHLWRVRFFQRWNAVRMLLFLAATSSVVAGLFAGWGDLVVKVLGSVSALFAAAEMVLRLGPKEIEHRSFAKQYVSLERDIEAKGEELSDHDLDAFRAAYLEIEVDEPPILPTLNSICRNQQIQADHGDNAYKYQRQISLARQLWARFWYQTPLMDRSSVQENSPASRISS